MKYVVLYAEDDSTDMLICQHAFKSLERQIELHFVADGQSLIDWVDGNGSYGNRAFFPTPHIIIIDSKLTDMTGLDLLRWIRNHRRLKDVPVILHFGSIPPSEISAYQDIGITACVEKEPGCRTLVSGIRSILNGEIVREPVGAGKY
jgi:CheY-like chemotaxis protein